MADTDRTAQRSNSKVYLVGAGIASLASAACFIRDGGVRGDYICIFEETPLLGGSLDGAGSPDRGYLIRGGRMFTYEAYTCTFDLLSFIPSLTAPGKSIKDEIYEFNEKVVSLSNARLVRNGEKVDVSNVGFSNRDRLDLPKIMTISELSLGAKRIEDMFEPSFFKTNFWNMWVTTLTSPVKLGGKDPDGNSSNRSWTLWETLARKHPDFGRPWVFNGNVDESKWLSFTVLFKSLKTLIH